jgi:hypothetical protein
MTTAIAVEGHVAYLTCAGHRAPNSVVLEQAILASAARRYVTYTPGALADVAALADGYPYFVQAYGKDVRNAADRSPITSDDVAARPEADRERALFFGARYEHATEAERAFMRAMAHHGDGPVPTAAVARAAHRPLRSLSAARDALIRKTLIYSPERGYVAFAVPHFASYLREQHEPPRPTPSGPARAEVVP